MSEDREELVFVREEALKVEFVDAMGTDMTPVNAARISRAKEGDKNAIMDPKSIDLLGFLADHEHMTPFEHNVMSVIVYCPLYIRSQIHRHRTFAYNEVSRRYTSANVEFFIPTRFYKQNKINKQGGGESLLPEEISAIRVNMEDECRRAFGTYQAYLSMNMAREAARAILPQNIMTHFYMTGSLRNWCHFLKLRLDAHAQWENQVIAIQAARLLYGLWPNSYMALMKKEPDYT